MLKLINASHPLIGTWKDDDETTSAQYTVSFRNGRFEVSGIDSDDGEEFEISGVSWDTETATLRFESHMPSTGRRGVSTYRLIGENLVESVFTFTDKSVWNRAD